MREDRVIPPAEARATWESRWAAEDTASSRAPSDWVLAQAGALPPGALVVDLAGGDGRHAVPIAASGRRVVVVDFAARAVALARAQAPALMGVAGDVLALPLRAGAFDAIVITSFLERALFPHLPSLLRPGGRLIVETFTRDHLRVVAEGRARGPRNAAYLLAPGELPGLVAPLHVLFHEELEARDGPGARGVGRVVACRRD